MNLFDAVFGNRESSTAIVFGDCEITYGQLCSRTIDLARVLASLGISPGDRVALLLNDSPEFIEVFIAACSMGAIVVPINTALKLEDHRAILNNCSARVAFVEEDLCNILLTGAPETLHFPELVVTVSHSERSKESTGQDFWVTELQRNQPPTTVYSLHSSLASANQTQLEPFPQPDENQPAFLLYTSGSTGEPKGAIHRQADIFYTNDSFCREVLQLKSDDRLFSSSRLPFAYGLGNSFTFPLLNGLTSILCAEKPTPAVIASVLKEHRPTIFFGVPVVYNLLLEYHRQHGLDCSSLRLCISAGEALPAHLGESWESTFGVKVLDGIGSTEMLHMFISNHQDDVKYGSSGTLLNHYEARLLDNDGNKVEGDAEGNLWIKGNSAAIGYWKRPEETARTFVDGWVRTGDLYRRDSVGYWFHMGRSDDCFKSSGQWVSPVEVESVLLRHSSVARVAVVEDFDDNSLPCPCAFVVSEDVESAPEVVEKELRDYAKSLLPRFKQPKRYVFVNELPYTATGKVQRFKLRNQLRGVR